ncbi:hypothetical protein KIPB_004098 [Kipferlia bialata]|uniref:Uncharacterized protein n=1 Tax=Kipferlia bialata TaxID=797122 RepID=A0A9K3CTY4_9EUKA|nr:hypothetical protein KIPB_004098 [Kipferlia bialata]|eukprot:g4098.t1
MAGLLYGTGMGMGRGEFTRTKSHVGLKPGQYTLSYKLRHTQSSGSSSTLNKSRTSTTRPTTLRRLDGSIPFRHVFTAEVDVPGSALPDIQVLISPFSSTSLSRPEPVCEGLISLGGCHLDGVMKWDVHTSMESEGRAVGSVHVEVGITETVTDSPEAGFMALGGSFQDLNANPYSVGLETISRSRSTGNLSQPDMDSSLLRVPGPLLRQSTLGRNSLRRQKRRGGVQRLGDLFASMSDLSASDRSDCESVVSNAPQSVTEEINDIVSVFKDRRSSTSSAAGEGGMGTSPPKEVYTLNDSTASEDSDSDYEQAMNSCLPSTQRRGGKALGPAVALPYGVTAGRDRDVSRQRGSDRDSGGYSVAALCASLPSLPPAFFPDGYPLAAYAVIKLNQTVPGSGQSRYWSSVLSAMRSTILGDTSGSSHWTCVCLAVLSHVVRLKGDCNLVMADGTGTAARPCPLFLSVKPGLSSSAHFPLSPSSSLPTVCVELLLDALDRLCVHTVGALAPKVDPDFLAPTTREAITALMRPLSRTVPSGIYAVLCYRVCRFLAASRLPLVMYSLPPMTLSRSWAQRSLLELDCIVKDLVSLTPCLPSNVHSATPLSVRKETVSAASLAGMCELYDALSLAKCDLSVGGAQAEAVVRRYKHLNALQTDHLIGRLADRVSMAVGAAANLRVALESVSLQSCNASLRIDPHVFPTMTVSLSPLPLPTLSRGVLQRDVVDAVALISQGGAVDWLYGGSIDIPDISGSSLDLESSD